MRRTFQKITKPSGTPVMSWRYAVGDCADPERIEWHVLERLTLDLLADLFCAARSGALNQASRSASIFGIVGQPNHALLPLPRSGKWLAGVNQSRPEKPVQNRFQPPSAGGLVRARRCTTVPQSVA